MDFAAIGSDRAFSEQWIIRWHFFHFGDHFFAVGHVTERIGCFEIMQRSGIDARLNHGWLCPVLVSFGEAVGEGTSFIVHIPIKGFRQKYVLGHIQAELVNLGNSKE